MAVTKIASITFKNDDETLSVTQLTDTNTVCISLQENVFAEEAAYLDIDLNKQDLILLKDWINKQLEILESLPNGETIN